MNWLQNHFIHAAPLQKLFIGERIAMGALLLAVLIEVFFSLRRFTKWQFHRPTPAAIAKAKKKAKAEAGIWSKVILLLVALLPGGLVASVTFYAIAGKEHWRSETLRILGMSIAPAAMLAALRVPQFPWPEARDAIYVSGLAGFIFAFLQLWITIKLLRQWVGEPVAAVPWWPPLVTWLRGALSAVIIIEVLMRPVA